MQKKKKNADSCLIPHYPMGVFENYIFLGEGGGANYIYSIIPHP